MAVKVGAVKVGAVKVGSLKTTALSRGALVLLACAVGTWAMPQARASDLQDGDAAFDAGRYPDALRLWSAAARTGDAQAAFNLGLLYDLGDGVTASAETALHWYRRAADAGLGSAAFNVGVMYDSGRGASVDRRAAALWYARAAALGQSRAAYNLGQLYEQGEGVPQNPGAAIAWYTAASADIPEASVKASSLAAQSPPAAASGQLVPPIPAWPTEATAVPPSGTIQLVWTAPAEPSPVTYFVELEGRETGSFQEITASYVSTTALAVTLPHDRNFAWRVYAVASDGSAYAPSAWTRFGMPDAVQAAALHIGPLVTRSPGSQPRATPP